MIKKYLLPNNSLYSLNSPLNSFNFNFCPALNFLTTSVKVSSVIPLSPNRLAKVVTFSSTSKTCVKWDV